ncbi:hypothetical protein ACROYT_G029790 [Oculina patagonica]
MYDELRAKEKLNREPKYSFEESSDEEGDDVSGRCDNLYYEGVAIILKKGADRALLEWKPINSRLIRARLRGRHTNITFIQCYAATNDSDEEEKDAFYDILQAEVAETPRQDVIIIAGDLNA